MRASISFDVPFVAGKQRPRFDSRSRRAYTPRQTEEREREVWRAYAEACFASEHGRVLTAPRGVPVSVTVCAYCPLPASRPKRVQSEPYTAKPDIDNVAKLVLDALNPSMRKAGAWSDDAQVTSVRVVKEPRSRGVQEHTHVDIEWEDGNE